MVKFDNAFYVYNPKSPLEYEALSGVDFALEEGDFLAIVGRTGCGKSTLIQLINALLVPTAGKVEIDDFVNAPKTRHKSKEIRALRKKIGMVFQFPEYQLFEETVEKDVAFAPKNFGMKDEEALEAAHQALASVGLDESFYRRSPFELSGGEKRRVAIAGVLAYRPSVLVLDEPTAGLDPEGAKETMALFEKIHALGTTIVLVTHDMDIVYSHANKAVVMDDGKITRIASPKELFRENLEKYSLDVPPLFALVKHGLEQGVDLHEENIRDLDSLADEIARVRKEK